MFPLSNQAVDGGTGNDAIRGGSGADSLMGGNGFDLVEGGTGDNLIEGGADGDLLIGGDVSLTTLMMIYPGWTPGPNAQALLDDGNYVALWEDILDDISIA